MNLFQRILRCWMLISVNRIVISMFIKDSELVSSPWSITVHGELLQRKRKKNIREFTIIIASS